jgi:glutamyl-tRNA synthetase
MIANESAGDLPLILIPIARPSGVAVGRYAPSPTGRLHLGNLRTALLAADDIAARGGIFLLRMEDLDGPRTVHGSAEQILDDLRWLGIVWHAGPDIGGPAAPYVQSQRTAIYTAALRVLAARGLTYACTCSRKDLREASAPHGPEGLIYPGTCRPAHAAPLTERDVDTLLAREDAALRFRVDASPIVEFSDELHGPQSHDLRDTGDFVVRRRDGLFAYHLACALDDGLMGVTRVLRGDDLLPSTPRQVALLRELNLPVPIYRHVALVADAATGERMAKRDNSVGLDTLRHHGLSPAEARAAILALPNC